MLCKTKLRFNGLNDYLEWFSWC